MFEKPVWQRFALVCFQDVSDLGQGRNLPSIQPSFPSKEIGFAKEDVQATFCFAHDLAQCCVSATRVRTFVAPIEVRLFEIVLRLVIGKLALFWLSIACSDS